MKRTGATCIGLGLSLLIAWTAGAATIQVAADDASNYGSAWSGNGGNGFDAWSFADFQDGGFAGNFLATTASGDLNYIWTTPGFKAWGTFANSAGFNAVVGYRGFGGNSLDEAGDVFLASIEHDGIQAGGSAGIVLRQGNNNTVVNDYNSQARFEFGALGSSGNYQIFDGDGTLDTGIGRIGSGVDIRLELNSIDTYTVQVFSSNGGASLGSFSRTLGGTAGAALDSVALYNRDAENANVYFNSLQIYDFQELNAELAPEPGTVGLLGAGLLVLRGARKRFWDRQEQEEEA